MYLIFYIIVKGQRSKTISVDHFLLTRQNRDFKNDLGDNQINHPIYFLYVFSYMYEGFFVLLPPPNLQKSVFLINTSLYKRISYISCVYCVVIYKDATLKMQISLPIIIPTFCVSYIH